MTRCESYPLCFGTIYFPTAPFSYSKVDIQSAICYTKITYLGKF